VDFILSGRARVTSAGAVVELGPSACVYHPGNVAHALEAVGSEPLRYLSTLACEQLGQAVEELPVNPEPGASSIATIHASGSECSPEWKLLEPTKGPRLRYRRLIDLGVEVIAGLCEIDPATHYSRHYHDQPELYYVLSGEGVVWVGDALVEVAPGSVLY